MTGRPGGPARTGPPGRTAGGADAPRTRPARAALPRVPAPDAPAVPLRAPSRTCAGTIGQWYEGG